MYADNVLGSGDAVERCLACEAGVSKAESCVRPKLYLRFML